MPESSEPTNSLTELLQTLPLMTDSRPILTALDTTSVTRYLDATEMYKKKHPRTSVKMRQGITETLLEAIYLFCPEANPEYEAESAENKEYHEEKLKEFLEARTEFQSWNEAQREFESLRLDYSKDAMSRIVELTMKMKKLIKRSSKFNLETKFWLNLMLKKFPKGVFKDEMKERITYGSISKLEELVPLMCEEMVIYDRYQLKTRDNFNSTNANEETCVPTLPNGKHKNVTPNLQTTSKNGKKFTGEKASLLTQGKCFICKEQGTTSVIISIGITLK
ncbi:hypothetical protein RCL1_008706 [Eukaryota sp. TZLM3-RCL]